MFWQKNMQWKAKNKKFPTIPLEIQVTKSSFIIVTIQHYTLSYTHTHTCIKGTQHSRSGVCVRATAKQCLNKNYRQRGIMGTSPDPTQYVYIQSSFFSVPKITSIKLNLLELWIFTQTQAQEEWIHDQILHRAKFSKHWGSKHKAGGISARYEREKAACLILQREFLQEW